MIDQQRWLTRRLRQCAAAATTSISNICSTYYPLTLRSLTVLAATRRWYTHSSGAHTVTLVGPRWLESDLFAVPPAAFAADDRGNFLHRWSIQRSGTAWFVLLRATDLVADHVIKGVPDACACEPGRNSTWTHRISLEHRPDDAIERFLDRLQRTLVFRPRPGIDGVVALDHYTRATADGPGWEYTRAAAMLRTIKYHASTVPREEVRAVGQTLSLELANIAREHPWLASATRILPVPGHRRIGPPSTSVRIAQTFAAELHLPVTPVATLHEFRRSAKDMGRDERAALLNEFVIDHDLRGRPVLIVDDVYQTGCTMAGVARAARKAGAATVLGIVAARAFDG